VTPDLATLTAQPVRIRLAGAEYLATPLTLADRGAVQARIKEAVPHPVDAIRPHIEGLAPEERKPFLEDARAVLNERGWPPRLGTPEGNAVACSDPGCLVEILHRSLGREQAGFTKDHAERLFRSLSDAEVGSVIEAAFELAPRDEDGPKKGRAGATTAASP
jgi:hypothetical protein